MKQLAKYFITAVICIAATYAASSQTTALMYQGQLQSSSAAANGSFDFEFLLFDSGGSQVGPVLARNGVTVSNGIFSVNLDFGSSFPGASRFLEIRVRPSGGGAFTTLSPRQPVTSAPYSVKSLTANSADNATNAANAINATNAVTATNFTGNLAGDVTGTQSATTVARLQNRNVANTAPSNGQVLKYNTATSQWTPDTDNTGSGGGGTITGVTPGTGLTGGGTTGTVTLNIANSGVGTLQIADNNVTDAKINSISGGKVTGTVANATNAENATTATNALSLGGVAANQYLQTNGNGSALTNLNASSITTGTLANARLGQIPTANIADNAVTSAKIAGGQVVKSVNGLTDNITLAQGNNITITPAGNTLTIASTSGGVSGSGTTNTIPLWSAGTTLGNSVITQSAAGNVGIDTTNPLYKLQVTATTQSAAVHGEGPSVGVRGDGSFAGVHGLSTGGTGVSGQSNTGFGVTGLTVSGTGVSADASASGSIALRTNGSSWFRGDTTPLSVSQTGSGTGIVVGSNGNLGHLFAYDYSAGQSRNLLLNHLGGNVGIGTTNPGSKLHVVTTGDAVSGQSTNGIGVFGISGSNFGVQGRSTTGRGVYGFSESGMGLRGESFNTGSIALSADGSSWFKGDTTPLSASLTGTGTGIVIGSGGNLGYIQAFDYSAFQTKILALNNSGGNVGIGTTTPDQALSVNGNASKSGGGSWLVFSDERLKNIKGRFTPGLAAVMRLQPVLYRYKTHNKMGLKAYGEYVGFSAQAVEQIIPEAVTKNEQGYRLVNNDPILWTMLNAIKEQQKIIENQQLQIDQLKKITCVRNKKARICRKETN